MEAIRAHPLAIVVAPTGSGKSTRIREMQQEENEHCCIAVVGSRPWTLPTRSNVFSERLRRFQLFRPDSGAPREVSKRASSQVTPLTRAPWALILAAREGHLEVVWYLADKRGAAIGAASADGCTALISAAQEGHLEVWQLKLSQFTSGNAKWQKSVQGQCQRP